MFSEFRQDVKKIVKSKHLTYAMIAKRSGVSESAIKCFMCGASDSRRIAEKIAEVLGIAIVYNNGIYSLMKTEDANHA